MLSLCGFYLISIYYPSINLESWLLDLLMINSFECLLVTYV